MTTDTIAAQTRVLTTQPAITPPTLDEDELPSPVPAPLGTLGVVVITAAIPSVTLGDSDLTGIAEICAVTTSDDAAVIVGLSD